MQVMLMRGRKSIAGSGVGNLHNHQECLDFCAKHKIGSDVQLITADKIDWAWEQLNGPEANKDGIRYVIDIKASLQNKDFLPK
jgi:uncharacterized zinc-type alcohol dehydrogenase-like protein